MQSLQAATAIDAQPSGDESGHAMLVQETLGQTGKRHIREGAKGAVIACGQDHLRILAAIERTWGVRWPIQTVDERPVGAEAESAPLPAEYDPRWVGDGHFMLKADYPEEENLARIDLEMNLALKGYGNSERVYKAMGEKDSSTARLKADKDRLLKNPIADALRLQRVAKKLGDKELQRILALQQQQEMAPDMPGMPGGVPSAALKRQGEGMAGPGKTPMAASIRGGIEGAQQGAATMQANAQAALSGGQAA